MSQGDIEVFEGVAQAFEIIPAPVVGQDLLVPSDERLAGIELRTIGWQTVFVNLAFAQGVFDFHALVPGRIVPDEVDPVAGKPLPDPLDELGALSLVEPRRAHADGLALRSDYARVEKELFFPGEVESTVAFPLRYQPFLGRAS